MIGPYRYDQSTMRYRDARGRWVKSSQVKEVVNSSFDRSSRNAVAIGQRLQRGEIGVAEWQLLMAQEIKSATLYASALANGGWNNLSQADYGRVGRWLAQGPKGGRGQYQYLRDFAKQIEAGLPLDGVFLRRSAMYVSQANSFFERERARAREQRGYDQARNIRHAADSCRGCIAQTRRGWQALSLVVYPGNRDCLTSCKCHLQFRNSETGEIAA